MWKMPRIEIVIFPAESAPQCLRAFSGNQMSVDVTTYMHVCTYVPTHTQTHSHTVFPIHFVLEGLPQAPPESHLPCFPSLPLSFPT